MPAPRSTASVEWSRPREAVKLFVHGKTVPVAWRVALVVGTILSLVNQGGAVAAGEISGLTWVRIGFNYLVPFVVASIGFLSACRQPVDR